MGKGNPRLRDLTWDDYGITKEKYRELKYFCLQYGQKKRLAKSLAEGSLPAIGFGGSGGSSSHISTPTETQAIRHAAVTEKAARDCRLIEEAAMWAASAGGYARAWRSLLRSVTEDIGYDRIVGLYSVPFGKTDWAAVRRAFYYRLDVLRDVPEIRENTGLEGV